MKKFWLKICALAIACATVLGSAIDAGTFAHIYAHIYSGVIAAEYCVAALIDARFHALDVGVVVLPYRNVNKFDVEAAFEIIGIRLDLLTLNVRKVITVCSSEIRQPQAFRRNRCRASIISAA